MYKVIWFINGSDVPRVIFCESFLIAEELLEIFMQSKEKMQKIKTAYISSVMPGAFQV